MQREEAEAERLDELAVTYASYIDQPVHLRRKNPAMHDDPDLGPDGRPVRAFEMRLGDSDLLTWCDSHGVTTSFGARGNGRPLMDAEK